ncbi:MAG: T9SS type A sorting domain-containing protein [Bacteroidia bacterium]
MVQSGTFGNSLLHHIVQLDTNGNELLSYTTSNTRLYGNIVFDANNNMYLSGSTQSGTVDINGFSQTVPEQYMMFVSRINNAGQTSWIEFAYDITFQDPQVVALSNGDAILGGTNMDSTHWGNLDFPDNFFGTNIFLTRIDSTANYLWGYSLPVNDTGYFATGTGHFFDVDSADNIYVCGSVQGTLHFSPTIAVQMGLPATYNMAILKLDGNGQILSLKTGGTMNSNYPQEIRMNGREQGFLTASIGGEATFDAQTTGTAGVTSSMLLRFDDSNFTSGIKNLSSDALLAYPNPFSNQLKIVGVKNNEPVQLYDISGKLTHTTKVMNEVIQLPELVSGVYLLHIGEKVVRLVKAN